MIARSQKTPAIHCGLVNLIYMGSPECLTYFQQEKTNHEQITKTKDLCLFGWKKLGNHQRVQEEIQPLIQSDYQFVSSEIPPRDDCLDLRRWILNTDAEESFWKGFRNMNWQCWLRKMSQRMKENFKRRFKNYSPRILKCEKSISSRWKKRNKSDYSYFCTETSLTELNDKRNSVMPSKWSSISFGITLRK